MKKLTYFLLLIFAGIGTADAQNQGTAKTDTLYRKIFIVVDDTARVIEQEVAITNTNDTIVVGTMQVVIKSGDCPSNTYNSAGECIELNPRPDSVISKMVEEKGIKWNDSLKKIMTDEFSDYASIVQDPTNPFHWLSPKTSAGITVDSLYMKRDLNGRPRPWTNNDDKYFFIKMAGYLFNRDTKNKNYEARGIAYLAMNSITGSVVLGTAREDGKKLKNYINSQGALSLTEKMSIVYNDFTGQIQFIEDNSSGINKNLIMKIAVAKALTELVNNPDVLVSTYGNWFWNFSQKN